MLVVTYSILINEALNAIDDLYNQYKELGTEQVSEYYGSENNNNTVTSTSPTNTNGFATSSTSFTT